MYDYAKHNAIIKMAKKEALNDDEVSLLMSELTEREAVDLVSLTANLMQENTLDGILDCMGCDESYLQEVLGVPQATLERWANEGLTEYEHQMLIYEHACSELECDRENERYSLWMYLLTGISSYTD